MLTDRGHRLHGDGGSWAVARFALSGLVAVALLAFAVSQLVHREVEQASLADAKAVTRLAAEGIVEPALTAALLNGQPAAVARFDRLVRERILRPPIKRLKLWLPDGRVLYSDEPRLIGRRFALKEDALSALRTGRASVEITGVVDAENQFESGDKELVEVYTRLRAPDGRAVLYEAYTKQGVAAASGTRLLTTILPALIGVLLILWLVQVPMAAQLARRLRRGQVEREGLLRRAIESSALERRRIARDLHDGPVQRLAGVSYGLGAAEARLRARGGEPETVALVDDAAEASRQTIRDLRTMLVELYPPRLRPGGLHAALTDLLAPLRGQNVDAQLSVEPGLELSTADQALVYRVAQEALRNVAKHADARHVNVRVATEEKRHVLEITDDGCGFNPRARASDKQGLDFGLKLSADMVFDVGGLFTVRSSPGAGTTVRMEVPA